IDDVALYTKPTNDLVAKNYFWGTEGFQYYQIPTTQVAPIEFSAIAVNDGAMTQNDVTLNVSIPSASYTGTSPAGLSIAANAQDTMTTTATFTPAATVATFPTTWNVTQTETDDVPANNILAPFTFAVTANTYATDNNVASSTTSNGGLAYKLGACYDIWNDQDLYAIDVKLNTATVNGSIIRAVLYAVDFTNGWDYIEVASSDYHDVVAADKVGFLTLELINPYTVTSSQVTYLAAIETDGDGGASNDVVVSCAQETDIVIGFQDENGDWYQGFTPKTNAPMIRMNFDQSLGLDESKTVSGLTVYPNPATDNINVDFNLANSSDVTIEVTDATGKVAIAKTLASQTAGQANVSFETSALNSGVYFVNISTEAGKATQKFIKK
ncbi:MAG: T9SS type A sorting domain-containing protein, partial [Crocinitomicaceae bacterium]|nr:T9SS type A sorting domain-containing protein [Crocinitomicaceae bacterium]